VETTVWAVDAILLRYKVEEDSDVHLVLSEPIPIHRRSRIQIPSDAPSCVQL
jgi:hypothetical protein